MRRIFLLLAVVLLTLQMTGCGAARYDSPPEGATETYRDLPGVTEEEISAIEALKAERDSFSYGLLLTTEAFVLPDDSLEGFGIMLCGLLSELFGIDFVPEIYEWDNLIDGLESCSIDFTGELTPTAARQGSKDELFESDGEMLPGKGYIMSAPVAERMLRVFVPEDSDIKAETDLEGLTIGFLEGTVTADTIQKTYPLSFDRVYVQDYDEAAWLLKNGKINAFVEESVADPAFNGYDSIRSEVFFPMIHEPVSMTTANTELEPVISVVSKYIENGGADRLYELYTEGDFRYSKSKLHDSLTSVEREFIADLILRNEPIRVAYEHDNYPINFYNEIEEQFEGIAVDVLQEIGRLIDVSFVPAVSESTPWSEIYEGMAAGEIQMVAQLLKTEARMNQYIWSAVPYSRTYYALLSRADFPDLAPHQVNGMSVGANRGSGKIDVYYELFPNNEPLVILDTQNDCLDALENGEIDLFMSSEFALLAENNYREKTNIKVNIRFDISMDSSFGFHKDSEVLASVVSKAQKFVNTERIQSDWTGRAFDYSKKLAEQRTMYLMVFAWVVSCLLIVVVFLFVRNIRLGREMKDLANNDGLTGVCNRRFFMELAEMNISRSVRLGKECFIMILDLDHFKAVNDTYGHLAGDKVLVEVAQRVKKTIRPYDVLGRYGGEEFIILMTDLKTIDKENVLKTADRIRLALCEEPVEFEDKEIPISASFGIAYAAPKNDMSMATKYADEALYRAKEAGRNRVVFYENNNITS